MFLTLFAGWQSCTAGQITQKNIATVIALALFVALAIGFYYVIKSIKNGEMSRTSRSFLSILFVVIGLPVLLAIPYISLLLFAPWCR